MNKIMFFPVALLVLFAGIEATGVLQAFCVDTLNQTTQDLTNCMNYANGLQGTGTIDPAILSYLCCLGFGAPTVTVAHNYTMYIDTSLFTAISQITTETDMPDVANFVVMCKHLAVAPNLLRDVDYDYWLANGKTVDKCIAV